MKDKHLIEIKNKRASFEYQFVEEFEAGIVLQGTEIKSIREGKANISEAFCQFVNEDLFLIQCYISPYSHGNINNHEEKRPRKLLLKRFELKKLLKKVKERGLTIIPTMIFVNARGLAKVNIALAKGKNTYDKRASLKDKDQKRETDRAKMQFD